jgi:hypothetical protein
MFYGVSNPISFNRVGEVIGLEFVECQLLTNLKGKKKNEGRWYLFRNDSLTKTHLRKNLGKVIGLEPMAC